VIQMGAKLEGNVVVLSGLNAGDTIVTSGNFLIDSESRLKSAMAGMQH
jgi:membrane fusion protein, copper/silver efflux system